MKNGKMAVVIAALTLAALLGSCAADRDGNTEITVKDTGVQITDERETMINEEAKNTYRQIGMDEAAAMMERESGCIILDVRRPDEFAAGHIPGAVNVPNETIGTDEISELPDKDQLIMVYCRSGRRSKEASEKLVKLGYTNIVEFGGILDWPGEVVSGE